MSMNNDTFDFINQPIMPNSMPTPTQINPQQTYQQYQMNNTPQVPKPVSPIYTTTPSNNTEPEISIGGFSFTTVKDEESSNKMVVKTDTVAPDVGLPTKKKGRKKSSNNSSDDNATELVRATDTDVVEANMPTINTYFETAGMIKNAMDQIDTVANEIKGELDQVRASRTMKSKYNVMVGLAGNLSDLLEAKVNAIKELNNCITKSNDMDYKREKDRREATLGQNNDEKAVMDLYRSIMQNPQMTQLGSEGFGPQIGGPALGSTDLVRAPGDDTANKEGYANFVANMTPEMTSILYEQNPDVKQCVVFDASTGAKWFQVMNVKTGQAIPNAPAHDQMFLENTTLDLKNKIAKNTNLGETYPLIVINDSVTKNY